MTLPGPDVTHRWQGRTLVDHHGEPLGNIEAIYLDKVTSQPEWALLEVGATGPDRTFIPLVSAGEEGDTVRVLFAKTLVQGAPAMAADRELSEEQERELYRHYGVPYSRADSPSGLPAGEPEPAEPALAAGEPQPAEEPMSVSTPDVAAGKPEVPAAGANHGRRSHAAGGGGALPEAAAPEPAPIPASAVGSALGRVDEPVAEASVTNDGLVATRQLRVTDPRVGAGAAAAVALAVGIWRRERIGRQVSTTVSRLGTIPATISRQRRRRRRAKALNQAVTGADPADHGPGPGDGTTGRRHGPVAGKGYRAGWPAGAGRRPSDPESDQPGCQAGSAWSPQKATGGKPGHGRRWGRRLCAGGQGRPAALSGAHRVGQAVAATAGGQTPHRAGRSQA